MTDGCVWTKVVTFVCHKCEIVFLTSKYLETRFLKRNFFLSKTFWQKKDRDRANCPPHLETIVNNQVWTCSIFSPSLSTRLKFGSHSPSPSPSLSHFFHLAPLFPLSHPFRVFDHAMTAHPFNLEIGNKTKQFLILRKTYVCHLYAEREKGEEEKDVKLLLHLRGQSKIHESNCLLREKKRDNKSKT